MGVVFLELMMAWVIVVVFCRFQLFAKNGSLCVFDCIRVNASVCIQVMAQL